ncbi:MAG TPA: shikimate dehydrogenase, partial [Abditibacteriaceae bacterium]|nr:shikimate dehydrogenase [Abditibacteriaceae bacterium]
MIDAPLIDSSRAAAESTLPTSRTRVIAIIGAPIEHSLTPRIQNAAWQNARADIVNIAFHVAPPQLQTAVRGTQSLGLLGLMVTIPHKEAVLLCCDELDESARLMSAANLLHFRTDGKIIGYSTDGWAALQSLAEEGVTVRGSRVAILGGGGAARSLAITFARAGAVHITLLNRTVERAARIAGEISATGAAATALPLEESTLRATLAHADLLVNATSIGMHPHVAETPVPGEFLHSGLAVYDIVYNPLQTCLLREAKAAGARTIDGLGMLIYTNLRAAQI